MSDQNNDSTSRPADARRPANSAPRIGRIGQWGGSSSTPSDSRSASGARIGTFRDLNPSSGRKESSDHDGNKKSGEEGETWFTGGERSGLAVQNPNARHNIPSGDVVQNLLNRGTKPAPAPSAPASSASLVAFSGSGNTLGSDEAESRFVPDSDAASEQTGEEQSVIRRITFWRDGFSIEDGPLMGYNEPGNLEILRAIHDGRAPPNVLNIHYGQLVELHIVDRKSESYSPPATRPSHAFGGAGQRLGAPTPTFTGVGSGSGGPVAASSSTSGPLIRGDEPQSIQTKFEVDQTQPAASIPLILRLANGTRMPCRMNLTHTIQDIRNIINASNPENLTRPYVISTMYPNRILDDDSQTIEAAGLQNSVVVQRWP